jgi:hypothetical protein
MQDLGLKVITRARYDANMRYLYQGVQRKGPGRKKLFDGKIDWMNIDKRRWKLCYEDEDSIAYELKVWSVSLKQKVKAVYVWHEEKKSYAVLVCSHTELSGAVVLKYYQLRFQIEFLIRDAKTHAGALPSTLRREAVQPL